MNGKTCERCQAHYDDIPSHFPKSGKLANGAMAYWGTCKACRKEKREIRPSEEKEKEKVRLKLQYERTKVERQARREERRKANMSVFAERQRKWREKQTPEYREHIRKQTTENYHKHRERRLAVAKKRREDIRNEMIDAYGGECACCGEKIRRFLTLDHKLGNGSSHRKTMQNLQIVMMLKHLGWPKDEYQVLCYNCNSGRAHNGGVCPHEELKSSV